MTRLESVLTPSSAKRTTLLPFALPSIGEEEIAEVVDTLRSGWLTTGPKVKRFESEFASYIGVPEALAVNSCTAALHLALAALGIGPGDSVIVPTLTFCSTANVVIHLGARPILVDVGDDFNIDLAALPAVIERARRSGARVKAIIPVHIAGQPCDLDGVREIAARFDLLVVEDAAHAAGAEFGHRKIGQHSDAVCFSFYSIKNMTTGEGGMITSRHPDLIERMRVLSLHGMSRDAWKRYQGAGSWYYEVVAAGYKQNMTDIQAAIGIHQLRKLDGFLETRARYAQMYSDAFADMSELHTPTLRDGRKHAWHLYVLRLRSERLRIDRAQFIDALRERNVGTSVHFIPVHLHPFYRETFGYRPGDLPRAETLYADMISLPLYPKMTENDVTSVIEAVKDVVHASRVPQEAL